MSAAEVRLCPADDSHEPMFHQGRGGLRHRVHPGNDHFIE